MFELVERLERMARINRDIRVAAASAIASCDKLLELRADFNFEASGLLDNLSGMMVGHEHSSVFARLQHEIVSMHQMLGHHQRRWPIAEIKLDPEAYLANSADVHAYVLNYIETSLEVLALTARPVCAAGTIAPGDVVGLLPAN